MHIHLVCKGILNHLEKLDKMVGLRTKWLWIQIPFQSLEHSAWISWKDIPTLRKHRKYIPLSNPNFLSNPKSFPCRNKQSQVFMNYFFLINILVQLTFLYFIFSNILLIRNGHKFYAAMKNVTGLLVCFVVASNEKKNYKDSRFISRLIKETVFFILNNYQFLQILILNLIATFSRTIVLHFSIFIKLLKCNFRYPLVHDLY